MVRMLPMQMMINLCQCLCSHVIGKTNMSCTPIINFYPTQGIMNNVFVGQNKSGLSLNTYSWLSFTDSKEAQKVMAKLTTKIQGGGMRMYDILSCKGANGWWDRI